MAQNHQACTPIERELYQLPGRINIQAPPLEALQYRGIRVPQFATLTQVPELSSPELLHINFGPIALPNDYPCVPGPPEPGMKWLGYYVPSPERPIPSNNLAYWINPYDINGPRRAPPHLRPPPPRASVFPPPTPKVAYQQQAEVGYPLRRPRSVSPPPHVNPFDQAFGAALPHPNVVDNWADAVSIASPTAQSGENHVAEQVNQGVWAGTNEQLGYQGAVEKAEAEVVEEESDLENMNSEDEALYTE